MSSLVATRFQRLIGRIQPTDAESSRIDARYAGIRAKLLSVFPESRVARIGSQDRRTGVRGTSDLDVLLEVSRTDIRRAGDFTSSRTLLARVRRVLVKRYPRSSIGVRGPAVVVRFGRAPVDIVPAVFDGFHDGTKVVAIPDGKGDWMATSPKAHGRFLLAENRRSAGQLRCLAQLVKFWRHTRRIPLPIQSFHVEMLLATHGVCLGARSYSTCMAEALGLLTEAVFEPPVDPLGISGEIGVASTLAQLRRSLQALERAKIQSSRAVFAEARGREQEAIKWWNKVFNNRFPKR